MNFQRQLLCSLLLIPNIYHGWKAIRRRPSSYHHPIGFIITAGANRKAFLNGGRTEHVAAEWGSREGENSFVADCSSSCNASITLPMVWVLPSPFPIRFFAVLPSPFHRSHSYHHQRTNATNRSLSSNSRVSFAGMDSVSFIRIPMVITRSDRTGMLWFFTSVRKNSCKIVQNLQKIFRFALSESVLV